jgi:predicted nucleotidyltransferase component of viral defense system
MDKLYEAQAKLMLQCLPAVSKQTGFALKGGTAINLFLLDMPRLSIDIDLAYLPIEPRRQSLEHIESSLQGISDDIVHSLPDVKITTAKQEGFIVKLIVTTPNAQIKIEPNTILRGNIFPTETRDLCQKAEQMFEMSVSVQSLSLAELYGGKICAALDRQHPRDLYDIYHLFKNSGITDEIRQAFVIYLASNNRPMHELLKPGRQDIKDIYEKQFQGMTVEAVDLDTLLDIRETLIDTINKILKDNERQFLLSVKAGDPDWTLMPTEGIEHLPALQWKLQNIRKMDDKKREEMLEKLRVVLDV